MQTSSNSQPDHRGNPHPASNDAEDGEQRHGGSDPPNDPLISSSSALEDKWSRSRRFLKDFGDKILYITSYFEGDLEAAAVGPFKHYLTVDLRELQQMRLRKLQMELASRVMSMTFREEEPDDWETLLEKYITAVREYDYIQTSIRDSPNDNPFQLSGLTQPQAKLLESAFSRFPEKCRDTNGPWSSIIFNEPIDSPSTLSHKRIIKERKMKFYQTLQRMGVAVVAVVFLIGPVWLMVLQKQLYTTLTTTTAFVSAIGLVISLIPAFVPRTGIGFETVFSVTAAYAAVLVVFVGTTTSGS